MRRNIARVRARLRAMLAEEPHALCAPVLAVYGLHAATLSAMRRLAWAFARRELETGFSMGFARATIAACAHEPDEELNADDAVALLSWVLLVLLRGRLAHLRRWLAVGTTKDRDAIWGRLLSRSLPLSLRGDGRGRHDRLRNLLRGRLPGLLHAQLPILEQLVALAPGRGLRASFERVVRPVWHVNVPFPERDFPSLIRNAGVALRDLTSEAR